MIRVTVDGKLVKKSLQNLEAEIPKIGTQQIYNTMLRARKRLKKPGARMTYPVPWSSVKQKIKVIIILKHVLNQMPYVRTGGVQQAFSIVKQKDGYDLVNETTRVGYLYGDAEGKGQIRMARGRYPLMREVVDEEFDKLPTAVVAHIIIAAKEQGFDANPG